MSRLSLIPRLTLALIGAIAGSMPLAAQADKVGAFVPANGYVIQSLDNQTTGARRTFYFGLSYPVNASRIGVSGDFDGDGKDSLAFYSAREEKFYLNNLNVPGAATTMSYTANGHTGGLLIPVAGDFNGDGTDSLGLFAPATRTWYLPGMAPFVWGFVGGLPVVGDWNGNGKDTIGTYDPELKRFALRFSFNVFPIDSSLLINYTPAGYPVAGDWNGNGKDGIGVFDSSTNTFLLRNALSSGGAQKVVTLGEEILEQFPSEGGPIPAVFPITGDWDEEGDATPSSGYNWTEASAASQNLNPEALNTAITIGGNLPHLNSLIVVRNGLLVTQAYWNGYDQYMTNNIKSCSKSVLSCLYGIALDDGIFPNPVPAHPLESLKLLTMKQYLSEHSFSNQVTLYDMITMSAGFNWAENPFLPGWLPGNDWIGFVVTQPLVNPGQYTYSTGLTHCGSEILTRQTGQSTYQFAKTKLFDPIGISVTRWDHEPCGNVQSTFAGGWEMFMRPRDMARFGQLFLNGGEGVVSSSWVNDSTTSQNIVPFYGAWWRTETFSQFNGPASFSGYNARGYGGQFIFVFPSIDLIVVMTSKWATANASQQASDNLLLLRRVLDAVVVD